MTSDAYETSPSNVSATGDVPLLRTSSEGTKARPTVRLEPISLKQFLARELALVKEVEAVFTAQHGNLFHIWTVINEFDTATRQKIYERERAIIDEFEQFEFDFNIVARSNRDLKEITDLASLEVTLSRL